MPGDDLDLLLTTIREAGALALAMRARGFGHKQKADGTFVTDVDFAVDALLKTQITSARPDDGWLSEETPDNPQRLAKSRLWIADPIDGTRGFLHGDGPWGIGMALTNARGVLCAAVFCPADGRLYHAALGKGAFLNGAPIVTKPGSRRVIAPRRFGTALKAAGLAPESHSSLPLLLRLAAVAEGDYAAAVSTGDKNDWDIAAGQLLVSEAGGSVTRLDGTAIIYNQPQPWQPGLVAATDPAVHAAVREAARGS
ncbi:MAG: 3'(2'),5'-bisphosphate nucleotidase CysQ [Proteobacteria bacterium]|nr:3'(2'),5'-bisphosphate nucleotidase CysQ [Pseudomonadota bacterium]